MKLSTKACWACLSLAFRCLPAGATHTANPESAASNLRQRQLQQIAVDETLIITYDNSESFSLSAFDETDPAGTTRIIRYDPDIPAGVILDCSLYCGSYSGTSHLLLKQGSEGFMSIDDPVDIEATSDAGDSCYASFTFETTAPAGPVYLMAYTDGALIDAGMSCSVRNAPNQDDTLALFPYSGGGTDGINLLTFGAGSIASDTQMIVITSGVVYYGGPLYYVPAGTEITCQVTCDSGGGGVIEYKEAPFFKLGEGTASNESADIPCPFSVTVYSDGGPLGWLLIYSLNSNIINGAVYCTTDLSQSPSLVPSTAPSQAPSPAPAPVTPSTTPDDPPPTNNPPPEDNCWCDWFGLFC